MESISPPFIRIQGRVHKTLPTRPSCSLAALDIKYAQSSEAKALPPPNYHHYHFTLNTDTCIIHHFRHIEQKTRKEKVQNPGRNKVESPNHEEPIPKQRNRPRRPVHILFPFGVIIFFYSKQNKHLCDTPVPVWSPPREFKAWNVGTKENKTQNRDR